MTQPGHGRKQADQPGRSTFFTIKVGWLAGSGLGSGLATWHLLDHLEAVKRGERFGYYAWDSLTTEMIALVVVFGIFGIGAGLVVGAVFDVLRKR
jgi:hypothetical protein